MKEKLFRSFCCVFYGAQAWNVTQACLSKAVTRFNVTVRSLFRLPRKTHCDLLPYLTLCPSLTKQLSKRFSNLFLKTRLFILQQNFFCNDTRSITSLNFSVIHGDQPDQPPKDVVNGNFVREMLVNNFTSDLQSKAEIHCIF